MRRIVEVRAVMVALCAAALTFAAPVCLTAQRGGGHFGGAGFGARANFRAGFGGNFGRYGGFGAIPLLDPFYADALYDAGYPVAAQLPVIIVQGGTAAQARMQTATAPVPLMIELQNGRYVQVSGDARSGSQMLEEESSRPANGVPGSSAAREPPADAVLVFRDGHQEQISGYTIADGVLYGNGDFYSGGSWDKRIELSSLNLEETVRLNQARGVRFRLPAARNEVMVGP